MTTIELKVFDPHNPNVQELRQSIDVAQIQSVGEAMGTTGEIYVVIYTVTGTQFLCKNSYEEVMAMWKA